MKAVVFHEFGGLDVLRLEEVDDPQAGPGEVVLDVAASALNHLDVDIREGISRFPIELRTSSASKSSAAWPRPAQASKAGSRAIARWSS